MSPQNPNNQNDSVAGGVDPGTVVAGVSPASEKLKDAFTVIRGGVEREVEYRDGQRERVIIRELPVRLLQEWSALTVDEAALVELYCDKKNPHAEQLRKLRTEEFGILQLISRADNTADIQKASDELAVVRNQIDKLTAEGSWDDRLTPESHDEILRIGNALNRPRFDRWVMERQDAIGHIRDSYEKYIAPLLPQESNETANRRMGEPATATPSETSSPMLPSSSAKPTVK